MSLQSVYTTFIYIIYLYCIKYQYHPSVIYLNYLSIYSNYFIFLHDPSSIYLIYPYHLRTSAILLNYLSISSIYISLSMPSTYIIHLRSLSTISPYHLSISSNYINSIHYIIYLLHPPFSKHPPIMRPIVHNPTTCVPPTKCRKGIRVLLVHLTAFRRGYITSSQPHESRRASNIPFGITLDFSTSFVPESNGCG